ncbi:ATP-dependent nuclease [Thiopseudomonas acetoxidans]|uniref:AAA family ATPase n=1 Tax=Thiopseudomonas acetoxidans TaxID=3041622 RepID=A0ABT7SMK9_9GAMM|nr:AAA family ATPase [Thiopseudomonas sp. CY1220]MDM7857428.1 AAA family ATPase [Thiopseudomonas sp. CY1220]
MQYIKKIKLKNFKKFKKFEFELHKGLNTLIGDNESGKSSVLQAIELVASGSRYKVENLGLDALLNKDAVNDFLQLQIKTFEQLPELHAELFLAKDVQELNGKYNTENIETTGLHLSCIPDENLIQEINEALKNNSNSFPYEFYSINFFAFSGEGYTGYRKALKTLLIDNTQINSEHANNEYIKRVFESTAEPITRAELNNQYREAKGNFKNQHLVALNATMDDYIFDVRSGAKYSLESDLTLTKDDVPLEQRGKGQQCFVKTDFALSRNKDKAAIEVLLIEEPENHLSFTNMHKLISRIEETEKGQKIIATHSSLISTRLDLRQSFLLAPESQNKPLTLECLDKDTAKFFMKAPNHNFLEFALSQKVILIEGDAEYMLLEAFYKNVSGGTHEDDGVTIISVGGTSFKRYMEVAKILGIKTAVITDNDKNYQENCVVRYGTHTNDSIKVFSDEDNTRYTLEACVYQDNTSACSDLFQSKDQLQSMLNNKSEAAFRLVENHAANLIAPSYIEEAIRWINE